MHPTVTKRAPPGINWAEVAARAKADLGDERVEKASARLRMAMMAAADSSRPEATWGRRSRESAPTT